MFDLCSIEQDDWRIQDIGGKLEEAREGKDYFLFIHIHITKESCILSVGQSNVTLSFTLNIVCARF